MLVEQHKTRWFLPLAKTANLTLSNGVGYFQSFCPIGLGQLFLEVKAPFYQHLTSYLSTISFRRLGVSGSDLLLGARSFWSKNRAERRDEARIKASVHQCIPIRKTRLSRISTGRF